MVTCCVSSPIPIERLQHRLNSILPPSIRVMEMSPSTAHFHPSLHAIKKEYHYSTDTSSVQTPFHKEFSWHFPYPLDLHKMLEASKYFIGEHDFAAFANHGTHDHTLRVVHQIGISEGPVHVFSVVGESFLYKMVRNLVGTLVYVGCGKLKIEDIPLILESKSRSLAGMCAPAHGLTLKRIYY